MQSSAVYLEITVVSPVWVVDGVGCLGYYIAYEVSCSSLATPLLRWTVGGKAPSSHRTMHGSEPVWIALITAGILGSNFCVPWATVCERMLPAKRWNSLTPQTATTFQPPEETLLRQQPYSHPTSVTSASLRRATHAMHRSLAAISASVYRVRHG